MGGASELDRAIAQAIEGGPSLWASLFGSADLGVDAGADEALAAQALRRAGVADLAPDKLRALIAKARAGN